MSEVRNSHFEDVLSVVLPDSSEMGLLGHHWLLLVRINHILLGNELRGNSGKIFPFFLELFSSLWGGSVKTEDKFVLLVSMSERVNILLEIIHMSTISHPGRLRHFVVEES